MKVQPKIVIIGGGTGVPTLIEGLRDHTDQITSIVTVTDSGRSSGLLRKELNVLPPGDIRNCLIALSHSDKLLCDLFQYRFENGSLEGHSFGNLFIAALTKQTGSFEKAITKASKILQLKGKVLPSTFENTHICAELMNGDIITEENNIVDRNNQAVHTRSPIKRVFLKPSAKANEKAITAIKDADLVILAPGSLYTSIITNLLVEGIPEAIAASSAKSVYVCNIMTQVSQTYNYSASDHVQKIFSYLPKPLDYAIINTKKPDQKLLESYEKEHAFFVSPDKESLEKLGTTPLYHDLLDESADKKMLWEKKDLLRHDPQKIVSIVLDLLEEE